MHTSDVAHDCDDGEANSSNLVNVKSSSQIATKIEVIFSVSSGGKILIDFVKKMIDFETFWEASCGGSDERDRRGLLSYDLGFVEMKSRI